MEISANQAAFLTVTGTAVVTIGAVFGAATVASTVATVAFTALGVTAGGAAIGSITAWIATKGGTADEYFSSFQEHASIAVAGMWQFFAQTLLQALIQGLAQGVGQRVRRKVGGVDFTHQQVS